MRCVRNEIILILFINALHAHCRTVLKTHNISETDSLFSIKGYESSGCICENGNCVNEGGKEICKCNPGYENYKRSSCIPCDCGPDTVCMWTSGWFDKKICFCKPGYAQRKDKCVACECGPDSNCTFSGLLSQKKCICKPGYWEVDGKCVGEFFSLQQLPLIISCATENKRR
ncbi:hypothetical protein AVEN_256727-1 [Araneus ventricosus]|uniref:EGF-like domain-containing protein n=1 Tax=Araneus ventricosus TaxID=182803 RepID=A0A4Y2FRK3_ARAVE|nr:hypothetical protein AVEN_256727-1 [Araneus ventricosus]